MAVTFGSYPKNFRYFSNQSKHSTSAYEYTRAESAWIIARAQNGNETKRESLLALSLALLFCLDADILGFHIGCYISHAGICCTLWLVICGC